MRVLKRLIFRAARIRPLGFFVGKTFEFASGLLPLSRHGENAGAICFAHPVPFVPFHLLIIPKRRIATIFDLTLDRHRRVLDDVFALVGQTLSEQGGGRYFLSVNYGSRQDVMQVHFHLTRVGLTRESGSSPADSPPENASLPRWTTNADGSRRLDVTLPDGQDNVAAGFVSVLDGLRADLADCSGLTIELPLLRRADAVVWPAALYVSTAA